MRKLRSILQYRYTFKVITLFVIIIEILFLTFNTSDSKYNINDNKIKGTVISYDIDGNKLSMIVKGSEKIVTYYYFDTLDEKEYYLNNLSLGDYVLLEGSLDMPSNNTLPNIFNYKKYLKNHYIYYIMNIDNIKIESSNTSVLYEIKNILIKRIESIDSTGYLKTFILNSKSDIDKDTISSYQTNGISHLLSVSGMHISLFIGILFYILDKITYNKYIKYSICIMFLLFYLFLCGYSSSVLRASIMFILFSINKIGNFKIRDIDLVLLVLDIILLINPYIVFDMGFQFSYIISFTLITFKRRIKSIGNYWVRSLYISFICFIVSFPICIYYFYQVNFLQILLNLIFIPFVSIIFFPVCILTLIFPFLEGIVVLCSSIMEHINSLVLNISIFQVIFCKPSIIIIFIYYIVIFISFYNRKFFILLFMIMIIHKNIIYFNSNMDIVYLDVGQGDSIFIKLPYNRGNILIDTGGTISYNKDTWEVRSSEYSIVNSKTIPYLKSIGVNKIDYLIITHGDNDHMGESINLVNNFRVDRVIFNKGEYNDLESDLIYALDNKNIKYYKGLKELDISNIKLYFLNSGLYDNENDNSNVIYFKYNNYKFLFMGDASINRESDILDKYNISDIDFLKVGHHGSSTSSSEYFINSINPKYSIISVGKNNIYGHPVDSVLKILSNSNIYRTDNNGSIYISLSSKGYKIRTYSP